MLSLLLNHQEEEGTLSWVARDSQDMLESRIHSRCSASSCILMVRAALESKPSTSFSLRGVCISGSEADPDSSEKLLTSYTDSPQTASEKNHYASRVWVLPPMLYPRTFSTDLDNVICESQGGEKGKWDANGRRRSSFPRVQQIGITGLLTKPNDLKYLPARLCLLSPSMAAKAF